MSRVYHDITKASWPACQPCEHCDGEKSSLVRVDDLRGNICPVCDDAIDAMEREESTSQEH